MKLFYYDLFDVVEVLERATQERPPWIIMRRWLKPKVKPLRTPNV